MNRQWGYLAWLFGIAVFAFSQSAQAEVKILSLPSECADFAFNYDTGDLAMVVPDKNEAWLIRSADLQAGKVDTPIKLKVGSAPSSIFYKKFKDTAVYAIVCSQDSHMYLMNAADGLLVKKIDLAHSGVRHVTGSINPDDPFVYYNYGGGDDFLAGALNLRTMRNQPLVFVDANMSFISASGEVAYRLGAWSPSGFESLQRTTSLTDDNVTFARLFYGHDTKGRYIPDPFDRYTAASRSIYSRNLEKREADLTILPQCFFRKMPVLVGYERVDHFENQDDSQRLQLRAASYNTFSAFGDVVSFNVRHQVAVDEFGQRQWKERMFASDSEKQVIYANGQNLALVPLADFNVPKEPFLLASFEGGENVLVGKETKFLLKLLDPQVEFEVEFAPDGMQVNGNEFTWAPSDDQVGLANLSVMLRHGDFQRSQTFGLQVSRPYLKLPFAPTNVTLSNDQMHLLAWEGIPPKPAANLPSPKEDEDTGELNRMALVNPATGAVAAQKKLPEPLQNVFVAGDSFVLIWPNSPRCDVVRSSDLEKQKTLVPNAPIVAAEPFGQLLMLQTFEGIELYSLANFDRVKVIASGSSLPPNTRGHHNFSLPSPLSRHGLLANGILLDDNLNPLLLIYPSAFLSLPGADSAWRLDGPRVVAGNQPMQPTLFRDDQFIRSTEASLPNFPARALLEWKSNIRKVPGAVHTSRLDFEVTLSVSGDTPIRQTIVKDTGFPDAEGRQPRPPSLNVSAEDMWVVVDQKVYRTPIPKSAASTKLEITPKQSALALSGKETTTLTHAATGGKAPYKFTMLSSFDAITIDERMGTVTLTEKPLLEEATKSIEQQLLRAAGAIESPVDEFRKVIPSLLAHGEEILGRRPNGFPVAIPIRVEVTDDEQAAAVLQYFVIAEIPTAPLIERLRALAEERRAKLAATPPMPVGPAKPVETTTGGDADLRRKVEAMEGRIDNLSRQLNEVLRRLDAPK